mmetsp:Transcript_52433/g.152429  ORF Transcript_52433/g.152429 Transcript_52433/m.152429 type:complete len:207 (+) Transcript_52433:771-1391(+)
MFIRAMCMKVMKKRNSMLDEAPNSLTTEKKICQSTPPVAAMKSVSMVCCTEPKNAMVQTGLTRSPWKHMKTSGSELWASLTSCECDCRCEAAYWTKKRLKKKKIKPSMTQLQKSEARQPSKELRINRSSRKQRSTRTIRRMFVIFTKRMVRRTVSEVDSAVDTRQVSRKSTRAMLTKMRSKTFHCQSLHHSRNHLCTHNFMAISAT